MTDEIPTLSKEDLIKPVQAFLKNDSAEPFDWKLEHLTGGVGHEITKGIYCVTGKAEVGGQELDWKIVLKMICLPDEEGYEEYASQTDNAGYWRREADFLGSDFVHQLPDIFAVPFCYDIAVKSDKEVWMWMEYVGDIPDWTLEHFQNAAYKSGQFGAYFIQQESLPDYEWLTRNFLKNWTTAFLSFIPYWHDPKQRESFWNNSHIQDLFGDVENNAFLQFMKREEQIFDKRKQLQQTICHGDFYRSNLRVQSSEGDIEKYVLIDWAYVGFGSLGKDLANLAFIAALELKAPTIADIDKLLFESYINGLRDAGWQGDEQQVRFGYTSALVLRMGYFWVEMVNYLTNQPAKSYDEFAERVNEFIVNADEETLAGNKRFPQIISYYARQSLDLLDMI